MINEEWVSNLVSDIIEQNCLECEEFRKPLSLSQCWCPCVFDIVDNELYLTDELTTGENENLIASKWEVARGEIISRGE